MTEKPKEHKERFRTKLGRFHDKHYKTLLIIPLIVLLTSLAYMGFFYSIHGEFVKKDISLTGGTSVTIHDKIDVEDLKNYLIDELEGLSVREIYDLITREKIAVIVETKSDAATTRTVLEDYLGYELTEENSSFEFTGSALSENFFRQLIIAVLIAFIFMGIVVFLIFRKIIPSVAVIISAFANIIMTLALFNLLGMQMSSAGIVAFLMLIGYSVDTDILLTNRVLRRHEDPLNKRILSAFETGITMTMTSIIALVFALLIILSFSTVLTKILTILIIGLGFDLLNTWITNVSLIKWYVLKQEKN